MKVFFSLPKSGEHLDFYNRYATLVPTLTTLGYLAQVVSSLTEFGIIYAIIFSSVADLWPAAAGKVATGGAIVSTAFLELGLRKLAPYSAKAILYRRFRGLDGWMTGFVMVATLVLLAASGTLSFVGSRSLVAAMAPTAKTVTTATVDSTATAHRSVAAQNWRVKKEEANRRFSERIEATNEATTAAVNRLRAQLATLQIRERTTGQKFTTKRAGLRQRITEAEANGTERIAELRTERADLLQSIDDRHETATASIDIAHRKAVNKIDGDNAEAVATVAAKVNNYGGGLAYFSVVCLLIFLLSVALKEMHLTGAGVVEKVEPGAYTFEAGKIPALLAAISGRINRSYYGVVHKIEKGTREAPEPVAAPLLWHRNRNGLHTTTSREGVRRKLTTTVETAAERQTIGFKQQGGGDASTQYVEGDNPKLHEDLPTQSVDNRKRENCSHCGEQYAKNTTWQKFCTEECRLAFHAAKHGKRYTPKPWQDGKEN